jgi:four helix bundle protein
MPYYNNHRKLEVWKEAVLLAKAVYAMQRTFPAFEVYALGDQLRRAVVSISANIAEGNSRQYGKERVRFFNIALSSLSEVDSLLAIAVELGYLNVDSDGKILFPEIDDAVGVELRCESVSKMLSGLIRSSFQ